MEGDAIRDTIGAELYTRLAATRVFMVGCGGIGCELLKNLVLSGFRHIHIVSTRAHIFCFPLTRRAGHRSTWTRLMLAT